MQENYTELGEYRFKIVLNPRFYKNGHGVAVELKNSGGLPMSGDFQIWGRKVNMRFVVDASTPDGVAVARVVQGDREIGRLTFWIIKP